jgi:hypothetical protein
MEELKRKCLIILLNLARCIMILRKNLYTWVIGSSIRISIVNCIGNILLVVYAASYILLCASQGSSREQANFQYLPHHIIVAVILVVWVFIFEPERKD